MSVSDAAHASMHKTKEKQTGKNKPKPNESLAPGLFFFTLRLCLFVPPPRLPSQRKTCGGVCQAKRTETEAGKRPYFPSHGLGKKR